MSRNARSRKWKQRRGIIPSLGSWSGPTDRELFLASLPAIEIKTHSPTPEEIRAQQRELLDMLGLESVYEDGCIRFVRDTEVIKVPIEGADEENKR